MKNATVIEQKKDVEKRLSKSPPITTPTARVILDDIFCRHIATLLSNWLVNLDITSKPWFNVLNKLMLDLLERSIKSDSIEKKDIYLQLVSTNTPVESKFLSNVYHGTCLNQDGYAINFPIGGTLCIYGVNDEVLSQKLSKLAETLAYLVHSLYLETYVMQDSHVVLNPSTPTRVTDRLQPDQQKPTKHLLGWFKKLTKAPKKTKSNVNDEPKRQPAIKKTPVSIDNEHRYLNLSKQMSHVLISTSPDCYFPTPPLLVRLIDEENRLLEQKRLFALDQQQPAVNSVRPVGQIQRRKSSFMTALKKRSSGPQFMNAILDIQLPQSILAYSSLRTPYLLPYRKGLEELDTMSLDSFRQHQSITVGFSCYPIGCPDRLCFGPIITKMDYFRYGASKDADMLYPYIDQSIGETIQHWYQQSQMTCQQHMDQKLTPPAVETPQGDTDERSDVSSRSTFFGGSSKPPNRYCSKYHGCQQLLLNHVLSFTHGQGRINVYTQVESSPSSLSHTLLSSIACNVCDASTPFEPFSPQAQSFSFAKFIESLFYSKREPSVCEHSKPIRVFLYNNVAFKFIYEDATFYHLALPRLRIAHARAKATFSEPRLSPYVLEAWRSQAKKEVNAFFSKAAATVLDPSMKKKLDADHVALLTALQDTHVNELNDFMRYFAIQSGNIAAYLKQQAPNEAEQVHYFPGSSVPVRELEPTSIIAYTLSCNDYFYELLRDEEDASVSSAPSLTSTEGTTASSKTMETTAPFTSKNTKPLSPAPPGASQVVDGYYSSVERKYVSPSTGATTETASFRTMITEVVKSSVSDNFYRSSRSEQQRWAKKQEESKLGNVEGDLRRKFTERVLKPLHLQQQQEQTKEVKVASYFYEEEENKKKTISPHIEHKFVHGDMEFTCIVYYAKEFEMLRRQCDIHQLMIESLSRCQIWSASGGKSKSHFYKTQDDRFVVKEMVNAWNLAEKNAFLKFAPKYFEHLEKSANEPSILAKVFGFFTIQTKNLTDKNDIVDLDVMVMDHLFFNRTIIKRFDFKGIQDRHVEEQRKQQNDCTLWDGDWLDEYRTKLPVYEETKAMMEQATMNDTLFLSKCNIMDYSLLVGIDQRNNEMVIGIVDFIGAYTWYKRIESRGKSTLHPGKEVTVLPPEQYKLRFCREVCDYFIPVPSTMYRF